jgi:hypothetical protein
MVQYMIERCGFAALVAAVMLITHPVCACIGQGTASVWTIDRFLARANLSEADLFKVQRLRQAIVELSTRGATAALAAEAEAMDVMGYKFEAFRGGCGRWIAKQ